MTPSEQAAIGGAISTSHHLATEAGARMLRRGGSAIDAAIAAAATLCVVYPNNVALGGDLVALVRDPSGHTTFVNATGRAPRAVDPDTLRAKYGSALPDRGIDTITVPGGLRGWERLATLGARLTWCELLEDAHTHANEHPVARSVARALANEAAQLSADPGFAAVFQPNGEPLRAGAPLRQPALSDTIGVLREHGPGAFYAGPLADAWITGLRSLGHAVDAHDAANIAASLDEPLRGTALGLDVLTTPPNTQGFALLRALRAVEEQRLSDPLGADAGALAAIFDEGNRIRSRWLADPDVGLTGAELIASVAPRQHVTDARAATGDTVGLVAVDDDGWAVSLVQSVYWAFGSGVLEPNTGVLFQNRGTAFSLDPAHPAAIAPGRRPPHTLMPVLVTKSGELAYANATMGGQGQAQIHTQLLLRLTAGADAGAATSAPRWVVGAQDDDDRASTLRIEADVNESARASLASADFNEKIVPPHSESLGHSNVIRATVDGWDAASDPRSDGSAIIVPSGSPR